MPESGVLRMSEQPTDRALLEHLTKVVEGGFAKVHADIELVSNDLGIVKDRVVILEKWKIEADGRTTAHSIKVRSISESDLTQNAELAKERAAREELSKRVDELLSIARELRAIAANPMVRRVAYAAGSAVLFYLASKGLVSR